MIPDLQDIRRWLEDNQLGVPAAILVESYRPLGFIVGQVLLAVDPLLPGMRIERWGDDLSAVDGVVVEDRSTEAD